MRRRRTLIIAFVLTASLALGIGYATTSDTLTIGGGVTIDEQAFEVKFTDYQTVALNTTDGVAATATSIPNKSVTFNVTGMSKKDDTLKGTFTIKNENEFTMYLNDITVTNTNAEFTVTTSLDEMTDPVELVQNETTTVDVIVTLNQGVSAESVKSFTIEIDASATAAN